MLKRRDGVWYIHLHLGGRRIRKSAGKTATRSQAKEIERRIIADHHAERAGKPRARPLDRAFVKWMDEHAGQLKSLRQIEIRAERMLPYIEGRTVAEIGQVAQDVHF